MPASTGSAVPGLNGSCRHRAVVVGGSAGGLKALLALLAVLPADFPLPIVVVLHTASDSARDMADTLNAQVRVKVAEAVERTPVAPGAVYISPGRYHLLIERDRHFSLSVDPRVCYARPSIDVLFESAAVAYRRGLIGVILTGANSDGAAGLARIKALGGYTMVQAPAQAEASSMPEAAIAAADPNFIGVPADIGDQLFKIGRSGLNGRYETENPGSR